MTSFPNLLGHPKKDPLQFHPTQRPVKLRRIETARNKEEEQGPPVSAMPWGSPGLLVTCSHRTTAGFATEKPMAGTAAIDALQISPHGCSHLQMPAP